MDETFARFFRFTPYRINKSAYNLLQNTSRKFVTRVHVPGETNTRYHPVSKKLSFIYLFIFSLTLPMFYSLVDFHYAGTTDLRN